jgi:hypothetical protein
VSVKKPILSERSELIGFSEGSQFFSKFCGRTVFCYFATRQSRETRGSESPTAGEKVSALQS